MKDYLQLDGLVYKLVPIKTKISKENPYELGRIDSELMYNIVKGWEWGNAQSPDIYHDPETRKNSISFRGNLHRLAEKLIEDGENEKSEKILDLSLEKMPIEYFGFYSLVEPYISTYYKLGLFEKGDSLYKQLEKKYNQSLDYYSKLGLTENSHFSIYTFTDQIITDTERFRTLVESSMGSNNLEFKSDAIENFVSKTNFVKEIYGDYEYYTLLIPFLETTCKFKNSGFCLDLYSNISDQLKERLEIFNEMNDESKSEYIENIADGLFRFSTILNTAKQNKLSENFIENESMFFEKIKKELIR